MEIKATDFTFQYVSINTIDKLSTSFLVQNFTFQYVSINTSVALQAQLLAYSLHSNMFLLIPVGEPKEYSFRLIFTFQYVSINTHRPHYHLIIFDLYIPICFY